MKHKHKSAIFQVKETGRVIRACTECHRSLEPDMQGKPKWPKVGRARARRQAQRAVA